MPDLLAADRFVVSQKPKLIELVNQYTISDPEGGALGSVEQEGQGKVRKRHSGS